ncbi:MAG: UDP-N-acetylmuramoyl-tripeptide--D-alanyl-D-alanine ligase [Xanthomonadales bacterium]|nr:UDP-N-acetylmuramoyl-tripeptide--D-alanyl-D-alanine ligase [Xanthomonadales bacterium]
MLSAALSQLATWLDGTVHGDDVTIHGVGHDTRSLAPGMLYVALLGERFDGHDFLGQAQAAGAVAALVSQPAADSTLPQLQVADTQAALAELARRHRNRMPAQIAAITGSNGKTTVKNLAATILARLGPTYANPGNFNNEIGLPLSVLELASGHHHAVLEMGAGKPGDIQWLCAIARPQVGLVNNIAPAHLERMGNLAGIAETKGAIIDALPARGVAIINADDSFAETFARRAGGRPVLRFGLQAAADVHAQIDTIGAGSRFRLHTPVGSGDINLPLAGRHNIANALAAAAIGCAFNAHFDDIQAGLEAAPTTSGRLQLLPQAGGYTLIDDSYNANPASVQAAIDTVVTLPGEPWLVLGDMGELGPDAVSLHADIGRLARQAGIVRLFTLGELSHEASVAFGSGGKHFNQRRDLVEHLRHALAPGVVCLVKGSRSAGMERVLAALAAGGHDHAA